MTIVRAFILALALAAATPATLWPQDNRPTAYLSHQDIIKTVSQSRGKVVVVNFWASWCGPCRVEIPELIDLRRRHSEDKLVILGVSVDQEPTMFTAFRTRMGINYPVYMARGDVALAFGVRGIPRTLVYGPTGEQVFSREGYVSGEELESVVNKLMGA